MDGEKEGMSQTLSTWLNTFSAKTTRFTYSSIIRKRYCTKRPKGKNELTTEWSRVDCNNCLILGEPESPLSPEMKEAIDNFLDVVDMPSSKKIVERIRMIHQSLLRNGKS